MWRNQSIHKVKTKFTEGKQASISVRPKEAGMQLIFPARLNSEAKKRVCLTFPNVEPFGISPRLGRFMADQLKRVVKEWRTLERAQQWVVDQRREWKATVIEDWSKKKRCHNVVHRERGLVNSCFDVLGSRMLTEPMKRRATEQLGGDKVKKTKNGLPLTCPTVYTAKNDDTYSIPIPDFPELRDGHGIDRLTALRVYPRLFSSSARRRRFGLLMIPRDLAPLSAEGERKRREYSLGVKFGVDPEWLKFVAEYVGYAASRWKNLKAARRWCQQDRRDIFVKLLKQMWAKICDGKHSVSRFWRIAASEVPPDESYIAAYKNAAGWGFDPDADRGKGLWCAKAGEHTIILDGPDSVSKPVRKPPKKSQSCYIMNIPLNKLEVFAPTVLALKVGAVSHGFIVQHSRVNPTHKFGWDSLVDKPNLEPLRWVDSDEEFTVDYGWNETENVESEDDSDSN